MRFPTILFAAAILAAPAQGQATPSDSLAADRGGPLAEELWFGYSPSSMRLGVLGDREGMFLGLAAVRFNHRVALEPDHAWYYTVDVFPLAVTSPPLQKYGDLRLIIGSREREAYGAGISPLGITRVSRPGRAVQWRIGATGGCLMFDRRVPTELSTKFNFTATVEGGVQLVSKSGKGMTIVYRLHHLSNAGTGEDNSGLFSRVLSIGARWR